MTPESELNRFCLLVLGDSNLQRELSSPMTTEALVAATIEAGRRAGCDFNTAAVRTRVSAAQIAALLRGIDV